MIAPAAVLWKQRVGQSIVQVATMPFKAASHTTAGGSKQGLWFLCKNPWLCRDPLLSSTEVTPGITTLLTAQHSLGFETAPTNQSC
jgi:hypothetical protein